VRWMVNLSASRSSIILPTSNTPPIARARLRAVCSQSLWRTRLLPRSQTRWQFHDRPGHSLILRYRVVIHHGDAAEAHIAAAYDVTQQSRRNCCGMVATNHHHLPLTAVLSRCLWNVLLKPAKMETSSRSSKPAPCASSTLPSSNWIRVNAHSLQTGAREYVLDIFSGSITLTINTVGHSKEIFSKIGERADVFSGPRS